MAVKIIKSDDNIEIDKPFSVKAGPGAGKTYWLVQHVRNVLANSKRLDHIRKIACITYTNVGVETIQDRLTVSADRVEVSTIHTFLYENIVGPYLHFIAKEEGFALFKLKVVDDTVLSSSGVIFKLKERIKKYKFINDNKIKEAIEKAQWTLTLSEPSFKTKFPIKDGKYSVPQALLDEYKKYAWEHGVMHYDDVLYFAYKLIKKYPFIAQVIGAKYPYIFLDEFQDSTPLQVEILKKIAASSDAIIGVIGDTAQAIYGFAGSDPSLFTGFSLPDMVSYEIQGNRRSSKEIIGFLNIIRTDFTQVPIEERSTKKPFLYVGNNLNAYAAFKTDCGGEVTTLSYANVTSNAFRKHIGTSAVESDLLENIDDSNTERARAVKDCLTAVELVMTGAMKDAMKSIGKQFDQDQKKSIVSLKMLVRDYANYNDKEATVFIDYLIDTLKLPLSKLRSGKAKEFYDKTPYQSLAMCISAPDVTHTMDKTIHKAKGDEYDNVLVFLDDNDSSMDFILNPNLQDSRAEYQRVYYVACSRAKNRLAISVPRLPDGAIETIQNKKIPIDIISC